MSNTVRPKPGARASRPLAGGSGGGRYSAPSPAPGRGRRRATPARCSARAGCWVRLRGRTASRRWGRGSAPKDRGADRRARTCAPAGRRSTGARRVRAACAARGPPADRARDRSLRGLARDKSLHGGSMHAAMLAEPTGRLNHPEAGIIEDRRADTERSANGMATLIRNGRIVTAVDDYAADILVDDGCIRTIGRQIAVGGDVEVHDAGGLLVLPGGVDVHTHLDLITPSARSVDPFGGGTKAAGV